MFGPSRKLWSCLAISIVICLYFASSVSSNGPIPTPGKTADKPKQQSASPQKNTSADQYSADRPPLINKIAPPTNTEHLSNDNAGEHEGNVATWWGDHVVEILLAGATFGLWFATWRLVRGAEQTAERQLRAYICVEECIVEPYTSDEFYRITIKFKNCGQTPAYAVRTWRRAAIRDRPETVPVFEAPGSLGATGIMGPGTTFTAGSQGPLPREALDKIRAKEKAIYVWGEFLYTDSFGKSRFTRFRFTQSSNTTSQDWLMRPCEQGNDAN